VQGFKLQVLVMRAGDVFDDFIERRSPPVPFGRAGRRPACDLLCPFGKAA